MSFQYRGMSVEAEGSEKKEQDIPIVIRADSVLEWLLERNVAPRAWMASAASCRKGLKHSASEYVALLDRMEELLRICSDQSRGLFGGYNDSRLAECESALTAYAKNSVHLAEMASSLAQIVKYEAPNEKKSMEKAQRALADVERLEDVVEEEIASLTKQYERQCSDLGIRPTGKDPLDELEGLSVNIGPWCDKIVEAARAPMVRRSLEYMEAFVRYTRLLVSSSSPSSSLIMPALRTLIEKGNVPRSDVDGLFQKKISAKSDEWEIEEVSEREETLLSSADSRALCLDDLHELLAFLNSRIREKTASEPALVALQDSLLLASECPEMVRANDEHLVAMRDAASAVLNLAQASQFLRLVEMSSSKAFVERMAASVRKRLELIDGAKERKLSLKDRRQQLKNEIVAIRERQTTLSNKQTRLTSLLQEGIGKRFGKRCRID